MTDITIPPEAVEAATLAIFRTRYSFDPVFPQDDHQWELSRAYAAAALCAGINAWPGMLTERRARCDAVVLPFNLDADIGDER